MLDALKIVFYEALETPSNLVLREMSLSKSRWRGWLRNDFGDMDSRVSHLQFFLISLLFQAGIYARHTKEQETYRFHMF